MNETEKAKEIERIIRKLVASLLNFGAEAGWTEVVAAEIGKLREADKEQLRICQNGLQRSGEELYTLLAQLAEMREALELAGNAITYSEQYDLASVIESINKALSAAPVEVLWAGKGTVKHKYALEDDPAVITAQLVFDELPPGWLLNAKDGQQVKVIIAAVNQKRLTMESKPKMVDKEQKNETARS